MKGRSFLKADFLQIHAELLQQPPSLPHHSMIHFSGVPQAFSPGLKSCLSASYLSSGILISMLCEEIKTPRQRLLSLSSNSFSFLFFPFLLCLRKEYFSFCLMVNILSLWALWQECASVFPTCFSVGIFSFTNVQELLRSFWISFKRNCFVCSCRISVCIGGGELKSLLYHHHCQEPRNFPLLLEIIYLLSYVKAE